MSVAAQFNGKISEQILLWFQSMGILSGIGNNLNASHTLGLMDDEKYKKDILTLIKKLDLSINDIQTKETEVPLNNISQDILESVSRRYGQTINAIEGITNIDIKTIHYKYYSEGNIFSNEELDLLQHESEGTKKLFAFAGPILHTLRAGRILLIDELDARLHPLITKTLVELFNSEKTNPNNAQLIFVIHDTNLLNRKLFRRDQIWFVEKDQYEATDLYSLVEYEISDDDVFENDYIKGRYGAIPFIGDLRNVIVK